jgi:ABC-2 type transport system permease protein
MARVKTMLRNVLLKTLWDQRLSLTWWTIALIMLTLLTVLLYPSFKDQPALNDILGEEDSIVRAFAGDVEDFTSPEGYLNSQMFFLMVPLLLLVFAIARGSGEIAGEEERGTLDLLLSNPVTRTVVLIEKFVAMAVAISLLALVLWGSMAAGALAVGMDISFVRLAEATISATLLGMAFGSLALAIGSATGKRGLSIAVAGAIGVLAYFLNSLRPVIDGIEPFSRLSPFYYYIGGDPLSNGLNPVHAGVLILLVAASLAIALVTFERRDLAV